MTDLGLHQAAKVAPDGYSVWLSSEYMMALDAVYDYLGEEGLNELDRQCGVDVWGNPVKREKL